LTVKRRAIYFNIVAKSIVFCIEFFFADPKTDQLCLVFSDHQKEILYNLFAMLELQKMFCGFKKIKGGTRCKLIV